MIMNIKKIQLVDGGLRGLKITHLVQEEKDGLPFMTPTKSEPKYPTHSDLDKKVKELRVHLLNLCNVYGNAGDENEIAFAVNDTDILEIEVDGDGFKLAGEKKQTADKKIKLKSYWVEEGDYAEFGDVMKLIGQVLIEVQEYVAGNKQVGIEELGQRVIENLIKKGKKGSEDLDMFNNMTEEEKKEFCKDYLMANGAVDITMEEDLVVDNVVEFKVG